MILDLHETFLLSKKISSWPPSQNCKSSIISLLIKRLVVVPHTANSNPSILASYLLGLTPKHADHQMMGIQNIKGIGLGWLELLLNSQNKEWVSESQENINEEVKRSGKIFGLKFLRIIGQTIFSIFQPIVEAYKTESINRIYRRLGNGKMSPKEARRAIKAR